jgi:hypothetical protein
MGENTKIAWTDASWNPWWGCEKVSPGCAHCYAETFSKRTGNDIWGKDHAFRFFGDKHWAEPEKWDRPIWTQDSPDGLHPGAGLWRVYHNCANPRKAPLTDATLDTLACEGCGQTFEYHALGSR